MMIEAGLETERIKALQNTYSIAVFNITFLLFCQVFLTF